MESAVEIGILAAATWPAIRFLSIPSIRRDFSGIAMATVVALASYAGAITAIAVWTPQLLRPVAGVAAFLLLYERWRARSDYGRRRGLPRGSLTLVPRRPWIDSRFYVEQAKRFGPVFKASLLHRPMVCILGSGLGAELFRAHERDLAPLPVRFNRFIPRGFLRYMKVDDHKIYRPLLQSALAAEVLGDNESAIAAVVHDAVVAMCEKAARDPRGGILPRSDLRDMFFAVLTQLLFALPADSAEGRRLHSLYDALDIRKMSLVPSRRDRQALDEILAMLGRRARELQEAHARGESLPACALAVLVRATPNAAEDETLLGNLVYILQVGRADLTGLFMWILKQLGDHPEWAARLRAGVRVQPTRPTPPYRRGFSERRCGSSKASTSTGERSRTSSSTTS